MLSMSMPASSAWRATSTTLAKSPPISRSMPRRPIDIFTIVLLRFSSIQDEHLARVHDVLRVDRPFQQLHQLQRLAVLGIEEAHLVAADAVLAGAGAAHGDGAVDQPVVQPFHLCDVLRIVAVDQQNHMEIAVADMA